MGRQKGFSLIELLIVVAIILIIAAIAVPNLLKSRMAANESSAVGSLRNINTAEVTYNSQNPSTGYVSLSNLNTAGLLDNVLGQDNATKGGYSFNLTPTGTPASTYTINASPVTPGSSGNRYFFTDQTGVIRYNAQQPATPADLAIQ